MPKSTVLHVNKKAGFEYFFIETYECGIVLKGTEIKSIVLKDFNIDNAYCVIENNELFIRNMYIKPYQFGAHYNHEPKADRKLLVKKREIKSILNEIKVKGITLIPTKIYTNERGKCKIEMAICKGKKLHDKRHSIKEKDLKRYDV